MEVGELLHHLYTENNMNLDKKYTTYMHTYPQPIWAQADNDENYNKHFNYKIGLSCTKTHKINIYIFNITCIVFVVIYTLYEQK